MGMSYWSAADRKVECPCGWEGDLAACVPDTSEEGTLLLGCAECGLVLFEASRQESSADEEYDEELKRQLLLARSKADTVEHVKVVARYLSQVIDALKVRAEDHDVSKLVDPELSVFAIWGPRLAELEYGTREYDESCEEMGVALQHHYQENRHHPEFHERGVDGMTLVDLTEMVCDWLAATQRMKNASFSASLAHNTERFNLSPQLVNIIANTARKWGRNE